MLVEDRRGALGVRRLRAHQAEQLALARRRGRTADRAFDKDRAFGLHSAGARSVSTFGATVLISISSLPFTSPDNRPDGPL